MSLLSNLSNDFDMMLDDWGQAIIVTRIKSKTLNADTGNYENDSESQSINGIVEGIQEKDIAIFPNLVRTSDKVFRINKDDLSFVPGKGDIITLASVQYIVIEIQETNSILKIFARKH